MVYTIHIPYIIFIGVPDASSRSNSIVEIPEHVRRAPVVSSYASAAVLTPRFVDACERIRTRMFLCRSLPVEMSCPILFRMKLCVASDCKSCWACAMCRPRCSRRSAYDTLDENPPGRLSRFDQTSVSRPHYPRRPRCSTRRAPCLLCRTMSAVNCVNRPPVRLIRAELIFRP